MASLVPSAKSVTGNEFGIVTVDSNHVIISHHNTNTGNFSTMREHDGAVAGYQVPAGKTLLIYAATLWTSVASTQHIGFIGWGDTDVGFNSVSAPTNSVNSISGGVLNSGANTFDRTITAIGDSYHFQMAMRVPASKYPAIYFSTGGSVIAYYYGRLF